MKLSTKGRYGLRAMFDLAINQGAPITIKSIAARQDISEAYLEQLIASLKKAGLVSSTRGAQGGYILKKMPEIITIGEILLALEGSTSITDCIGDEDCGRACCCPSRSVFAKLQQGLDSVLNSMTLKDMVADYIKEESHEADLPGSCRNDIH